MSDDPRIIELLAELVKTTSEMKVTQEQMLVRLDRLETAQNKTNVLLQQHTLSDLRLADKLESVLNIDHRVSRLEDAVFHA